MGRRLRTLAGVFSGLLLAAATLSGCSGSSASASGSNQLGLIKPGQLKVASVTEFLPFEYVKNNKAAGFDIDLVNTMAKRMGLQTNWSTIEFEGLLSQVGNDQYDLGAAAIGITRERKQTVSYSVPYYKADEVLIAPKGSNISGPASLTGKRVAVKAATTDYTYAQSHFKNAQLVSFPDNASAFTALASGRADAMFLDLPVYQVYAKTHSQFQVTYHAPGSATFYALALPRGHAKLQEAVDKQLTTLLEDGTYTRLYKQYFGTAPSAQVLAQLKKLAKQRATPALS